MKIVKRLIFQLCVVFITMPYFTGAKQIIQSHGCDNFLKGFVRRLAGDTILYRSYRNDVKWVMLTRVTNGEMVYFHNNCTMERYRMGNQRKG